MRVPCRFHDLRHAKAWRECKNDRLERRGRQSELENGRGARAYGDSPIEDARRGPGAGFWQVRRASLIGEDEFLYGEFAFEKLDRDGAPIEGNGAEAESGGEETAERANR